MKSPDELCDPSYQVKLLQAVALVSPVELLWIVKCKVTVESQPYTLPPVKVWLKLPDALCEPSYQVKLLQAVADVSPVELLLIVKCRVTVESQPYTLPPVKVWLKLPDELCDPSYQVKLLQAVADVSPVELL